MRLQRHNSNNFLQVLGLQRVIVVVYSNDDDDDDDITRIRYRWQTRATRYKQVPVGRRSVW